MGRLNTEDSEALQHFADRCGCTMDQLQHAISARTANEMDMISFLSIRGYISQDVFLRMRGEIT